MRRYTGNTKMDEIIKKSEFLVESCGFTIPDVTYTINKRLTACLGRCGWTRNWTTMERTDMKIELASIYTMRYLEEGMELNVMDTVIHEILHALDGGDGHGKEWKAMAKVINDRYGFNIKTLAEPDAIIEAVYREKRMKRR